MRWPSVLAVFAARAAWGDRTAKGPFAGWPRDGSIDGSRDGSINGSLDQIAAAGEPRWVFP